MTDEEKAAVKKRAIPLLQLLLAEGKHRLTLKELTLAMLKPTFGKADVAEAYDAFHDELIEHDKRMKVATERIYRMLFIEEGGNPGDFELWRYHMKHNARRRRKRT